MEPDCADWVGSGDFVKEKSSQMGFPGVNANRVATSQGCHVTRRMRKTDTETIVLVYMKINVATLASRKAAFLVGE